MIKEIHGLRNQKTDPHYKIHERKNPNLFTRYWPVPVKAFPHILPAILWYS